MVRTSERARFWTSWRHRLLSMRLQVIWQPTQLHWPALWTSHQLICLAKKSLHSHLRLLQILQHLLLGFKSCIRYFQKLNTSGLNENICSPKMVWHMPTPLTPWTLSMSQTDDSLFLAASVLVEIKNSQLAKTCGSLQDLQVLKGLLNISTAEKS